MMKTIHFSIKKCLCVFLIALAANPTASAWGEWISVDGFWYDVTYDDSDPWTNGTATMISRVWYSDNVEENCMYPIQYEDWNTDSIFEIPSYIYGEMGEVFTVTEIMGGFECCNDIKTVVVPPSVKRLNLNAFSQSNLEQLHFNDDYYNSVDPITFAEDDGGFSIVHGKGLYRLKIVGFSRPTTNIPPALFAYCPELEYVYFNNSAFNQSTIPLDTIGDCAFYGCSKLTRIQLPNSVKVIGKSAFAHCQSLNENLYLPDGITSIGDDAFLDCGSLTHFYMPYCVKEIGKGAFGLCHNLKSVNLPNGLTSIGDFAFADCYELENITFPTSLQYIGEAAFINCRSLTSISIPSSITAIQDFAFYDCSNLSNVNLNNVITFGECSFAGCNKLTEIDLSAAQSIGQEAFLGGKVSAAVAGDEFYGLHSIGISCRSDQWGSPETNVGSLKKITLGKDVSILGDFGTFAGHTPDTITCMAPTPPVFTKTENFCNAFITEAYDSTILSVPKVVTNAYREAYGWGRFVHIDGISILGNGDVNGDGRLSISDITSLINMILSSQAGNDNPINADVNGDGEITIRDVTLLIEMLLQSP